jgi:hypothetical protein
MVLPCLGPGIEEQYDFSRVGISCLGMHPFFAVAARTGEGKVRELRVTLVSYAIEEEVQQAVSAPRVFDTDRLLDDLDLLDHAWSAVGILQFAATVGALIKRIIVAIIECPCRPNYSWVV